MSIAQELSELVGETPLLQLNEFVNHLKLPVQILAKLEAFNPGGSAKDRPALAMIKAAEAAGILLSGGTIIEPTSGNMGIALAYIGTGRGYRVILTMPDSMSKERRQLLAALGAELVLTPGALGMKGAMDKAVELQKTIAGSVIINQFDNPVNPEAHYKTTGPEIWQQSGGSVDIFVAGVGTGGTISGVAKFLKEQNTAVQVVAVEPSESPLLSGGVAASHGIAGIGANFVPGNFKREFVDRVLPVETAKAMETTRLLAQTEGILSGISAGAALAAAVILAREEKNAGKVIVVILPDTGERYLSGGIFDGESA